MGVNLVTIVRGFRIGQETFGSNDHDVQDGCVTPGTHRVMRFDFLSYNAGDADMVIGSPASRPDLFVWSAGHGHYHLKDFNEFLLFNANGQLATIGYKQAFCAIDIERIRPSAGPGQFFDCNAGQGISAGWADVYNSGLPCQFIVIDGVPDGDYTLQSTTNSKHVAQEDCFADNTTWTGLRIQGNSVTTIDPPWLPEDRIHFNHNNVAAVQVSGRWKVTEGNHWMLDTGSNQMAAQRAVEIIKHYKLAFMCFVARPRCHDVEPMMYFLDEAGKAPVGTLANEDIIPFNPAALAIQQVGDRWKVVEGTHWLLDFGAGESNARAALHFIRKHGFNQMCFVARPHPPMTYFKKATGALRHVHDIDPRQLDFAIDPPRWQDEQAIAVNRLSPFIDFSAAAQDPGARHKDEGSKIRVRRAGSDKPLPTGTRHGVTGVVCDKETEITLPGDCSVVDFDIAHFGEPPVITVYDEARKAVAELKADPRPRQVERLRAIGSGLRFASIRAAGEQTLLVAVRIQPSVTDTKSTT